MNAIQTILTTLFFTFLFSSSATHGDDVRLPFKDCDARHYLKMPHQPALDSHLNVYLFAHVVLPNGKAVTITKQGYGFVLDNRIVTNQHLTSLSRTFTTPDGTSISPTDFHYSYGATTYGCQRLHVRLDSTSPEGFDIVTFSTSDALPPGLEPGEMPMTGHRVSLYGHNGPLEGTVVGSGIDVDGLPFIPVRLDRDNTPGNSGLPAIDSYGKVIGVLRGHHGQDSRMARIVPIDALATLTP